MEWLRKQKVTHAWGYTHTRMDICTHIHTQHKGADPHAPMARRPCRDGRTRQSWAGLLAWAVSCSSSASTVRIGGAVPTTASQENSTHGHTHTRTHMDTHTHRQTHAHIHASEIYILCV